MIYLAGVSTALIHIKKNGLVINMNMKFKHCNVNCNYKNHCCCVFDCTKFMLYDMCDDMKQDDILGSVQGHHDFFG